MAEIEEEVIGSQSEESLRDDSVSMDDVYEAFGIEKEKPKEEEKAAENAPAIEQKPEPKTIKVKHNKEEIEVDVSDDKLPEYVQKSLALDKERERKAELEKNLDRAAKLAGFNDHAEYIANLDKLEEQQQQQQQNEFQQLRAQLITEYEEAGYDPRNLEAWLDNNPLLNQAKEVLQREQERAEKDKQAAVASDWNNKWNALYQAVPDLLESAKVFADGGTPDWYNTEMKARIERGYDPIDAYKLAHSDKIQTQTKKQTEQRLIKEQHLGLRAQVETVPSPDNEPAVPKALEDAFEAFGLGKSAAKKYVK